MSHLAYLFLGSVLRVPALIFPVFHQLKSTLLLMNRPTHGVEHWALLFAPFSGSFYLACLPNSEVTFPCLLFGERNESHLFPIFAALTHHEEGNFAALLVGTRNTGTSAFVRLSALYFGLCAANNCHSHSSEPSQIPELSGHLSIPLQQS